MPKQFDIKEFEPYKNYVIDASAGTGKTYNIIEIVKKLVLENICKLNEILIVTFTDKAAGELKDRIRKGLGELYTEDSSIYTIHSFCDNVIKEFGVSSNLPLNMTLVSDENLYNFINEYIRNDDITTVTAFKAYLKSQYDAGTPVVVIGMISAIAVVGFLGYKARKIK